MAFIKDRVGPSCSTTKMNGSKGSPLAGIQWGRAPWWGPGQRPGASTRSSDWPQVRSHNIAIPPLTCSVAPVTQAAASDAR